MRRALFTIAIAMGLVMNATSAQALSLTIGDAYYLGFVDPDTPSSPEAEMFYINYLANLSAGEVETGVNPPDPPNIDYTFSRQNSTLAGNFPSAILSGFMRGTTTTISEVGGFFFLIAKYGTVGHVWVLNGLSGSIELPAVGPGGGLSHWTIFNVTTVPDGGATLGLLGLAMLGLGLLRQRLT